MAIAGGVWISGRALERMALTYEEPVHTGQEEAVSMAEPAADEAEANTTGELHCPDCRVAMVKDRFHPKIPVMIDRCARCGYVWLDRGEQELILQRYDQMVRSQDRGVANKREELATMAMLAKRKAAGMEDWHPPYDPSKDTIEYCEIDPARHRRDYLGTKMVESIFRLIFGRSI